MVIVLTGAVFGVWNWIRKRKQPRRLSPLSYESVALAMISALAVGVLTLASAAMRHPDPMRLVADLLSSQALQADPHTKAGYLYQKQQFLNSTLTDFLSNNRLQVPIDNPFVTENEALANDAQRSIDIIDLRQSELTLPQYTNLLTRLADVVDRRRIEVRRYVVSDCGPTSLPCGSLSVASQVPGIREYRVPAIRFFSNPESRHFADNILLLYDSHILVIASPGYKGPCALTVSWDIASDSPARAIFSKLPREPYPSLLEPIVTP